MKYEAKIAPSLQGLEVDAYTIKPHPKNIRRHALDAIQRSLHKYGQMKPIVVQKSTSYIIAGNGTYLAATGLGWMTIAASVVDINDEEAMGYLLADNRASDLSAYDKEKLKDALQLLSDGPGLFDTLWTVDEYEDLLAEDPNAVTTERSEFTGTYIETDEQMEARQAAAQGSRSNGTERMSMKEVPLLIKAEEHAAFIKRLKAIGQQLNQTSILGIIFACVDYTENGLGIKDEAAS